jgi:hypothetical protein
MKGETGNHLAIALTFTFLRIFFLIFFGLKHFNQEEGFILIVSAAYWFNSHLRMSVIC